MSENVSHQKIKTQMKENVSHKKKINRKERK